MLHSPGSVARAVMLTVGELLEFSAADSDLDGGCRKEATCKMSKGNCIGR